MTLNSVLEVIKSLFTNTRQPAKQLPSILVAVGAQQRPGLSSEVSVGNIAEILQEHGVDISPIQGEENKTLVVVMAIVDEIYRAIHRDANIQMAQLPGSISIISSGANSGGPVITQGVNVNYSNGYGIIQ